MVFWLTTIYDLLEAHYTLKQRTARTAAAATILTTVFLTSTAAQAQNPDTIDGVKPIAATPEEGAQTGGASLGYGEKTLTHQNNPQGNPDTSNQPTIVAGNWRPNFGVQGQDVSNHQGNINWAAQANAGSKFTWIKTSEGTTYKDPYFSQNYTGARAHGLLTGGYHFALPPQSSGAEQARTFVNSGGGWSADGKTLPGMLDIEYNPYSSFGNTCYNMSPGQLTSWVRDFTNTYKTMTGRYPTIYSTNGWWSQCMGDSHEFKHMPLHIASYATMPGVMPANSLSFDLWQYSSTGPFAGDSNIYNGSEGEFRNFAVNPNYRSKWGSNGAVEVLDVHDNGDRGFGNGGFLNIRTGIGSHWEKNKNKLGDPIGRELRLPDGSAAQDFTNGYRVFWNKKSETVHDVKLTGAIGAAWVRNGNEYGFGYPMNEETRVGDMWFQDFDKGVTLTWTEKNGTHKLWRPGGIYHTWVNQGGYERFGAPASSEIRDGDTVYQDFRTPGGRTTRMVWSAVDGSVKVLEDYGRHGVTQPNGDTYFSNGGFLNTRTGIGSYWERNKGKLGDPLGRETDLGEHFGAHVWEQDFTSGYKVVYSSRDGAQLVWTRGAIGGTWVREGVARFGAPVGGEEYDRVSGLYTQRFASGVTLSWSVRYGVQQLWAPGAIYHEYVKQGGSRVLGVPATSEVHEKGRVYQDFVNRKGERTRLVYTAGQGVTVNKM